MPDDGLICQTVVKIGGSLFDLPDLATRLCRWLDIQPKGPLLVVPGGGGLADAVRDLDRRHRLGEKRAHWLALGALALNARFLEALLYPMARVVASWKTCPRVWRAGKVAIADVYPFLQEDEGRDGCLPANWSVTSDSVAARLAVLGRARQLILLKSVTVPENIDWTEAGRLGFVDAYFAEALAQARLKDGQTVAVQTVNFRKWGQGRKSRRG